MLDCVIGYDAWKYRVYKTNSNDPALSPVEMPNMSGEAEAELLK